MQLDTDKTFAQLYPNPQSLQNDLEQLQDCLLPRDQSRQWAQNLRFIAATTRLSDVDNTLEDPEDLGDSEDSEVCCCAHLPFIGERTKRTVFEITSPGAYPGCTHYVAVSWCWGSSSTHRTTKVGPTQYWIKTEASKRLCGVPTHIMSRAIAFAASYGIPFLWIDKECIDQNNRSDKEFGIQSMDLVYQRSSRPLCLLECYFSTQAQIDVFAMLMNGEHPPQEQLNLLVEVMEMFEQELSFTRAWILQETVSGGFCMELMIQHDLRLFKPLILGDIDGEIIVTIEHFLNAVLFADGRPEGDGDLDLAQYGKLRQLIEKIVAFHPAHVISEDPGMSELYSRDVFADPEYRQTCNAAQALTYLALRKNSRVPDRLAIMANLCDYKLRLNTFRVEELHFGFSICAFALAVFNGDLSLTNLVQPTVNSNLLYGWAPAGDLKLKSLSWYEESDIIVRCDPAKVTTKGLLVAGWLWRLDSTFTHQRVQNLENDSMTITDIYWARLTLIAVLLERGFKSLAQCLYSHSGVRYLFRTVRFRRPWAEWDSREPTDSPPRRLSDIFDMNTGDIIFRAEGLVEKESDVPSFLKKSYNKDPDFMIRFSSRYQKEEWFDEAIFRGRGLPLAVLGNNPVSKQNDSSENESQPSAQVNPLAAFDVKLEIQNTILEENVDPVKPSTDPVYVFVPSTALDLHLRRSGWIHKPVGWIVEPLLQHDEETSCRILRSTGSVCRGFWNIPQDAKTEAFLLQ